MRGKTVNEKLFISLVSYLLVCLNVVAGKRKQRRPLVFLTSVTSIHSQTLPVRAVRSRFILVNSSLWSKKNENKGPTHCTNSGVLLGRSNKSIKPFRFCAVSRWTICMTLLLESFISCLFNQTSQENWISNQNLICYSR